MERIELDGCLFPREQVFSFSGKQVPEFYKAFEAVQSYIKTQTRRSKTRTSIVTQNLLTLGSGNQVFLAPYRWNITKSLIQGYYEIQKYGPINRSPLSTVLETKVSEWYLRFCKTQGLEAAGAAILAEYYWPEKKYIIITDVYTVSEIVASLACHLENGLLEENQTIFGRIVTKKGLRQIETNPSRS